MRILLVGDTHGNTLWWEQFVTPAAQQLNADVICQVGDFGYWQGGDDFLSAVDATGIPVAFLDGNHEQHPYLEAAVAKARFEQQLTATDPVPLGGNLSYLPRGGRFSWDGVTVAALGGARSIDRALRRPGISWFAEEAISNSDLELLADGATAQVLLCHDAPLCAPVPLSPRHELPFVWQAELETCTEHRMRLDEALDMVQPELLVHGHYHCRWAGDVQRDWGSCHVVGLAEDGSGVANLAILECVDGAASIRWVDSN